MGKPALITKTLSAEHKRRIGIANSGKKRPDLSERNKTGLWKGKKHTIEQRKKMSEATKGKKHYNWKGGITKKSEAIRRSLEYRIWRSAVFERDGFTCVECGAKNGVGKKIVLNADHIKKFSDHPELRFAIDNGRTLCVPCHKKTASWGGVRKKKVALVTGCNGQDGSYLCELLLKKGYEVHGVIRRASTYNRQRIEGLDIKLHYADMSDPFSLMWALKASKPDEVYNLAAQSHVGVSWETPWYSAQTVGIGVLNLLESIRVLGIKPKIYQASTSELFDGMKPPYDELSEKNPISPYGTAKLFGFQIGKNYRDAYGMFICNGILFNHESERRGVTFVTKKIVDNADGGVVYLGNTDAERDWGYAPEYVEGMWRMLQQKKPDDYVLATGEMHSVKEFVEYVEEACGHKIKIIHDKGYDRPKDVPYLKGNPAKAKEKLKWVAKTKAKEIAKIMYDATLYEGN